MARLKDDVQRFLSVEFLTLLALELGLCWRQTTLALPNLVALFARQILSGNLSMPELVRLTDSRFTAEAFCTARRRLPLELLQELLRRVCALGDQTVRNTAAMLWKGHRLGKCDQVFRWFKPQHKPRWADQALFDALPAFIEVREIKRQVRLPTGLKQMITLVTTLLDPAIYPAAELVEVLKGRWAVEVNLRHLKTTMKMEILRSQTVAGIEKELYMFLIVYNLVRLVMLEAAARQAVPVARISFADALYWVRHGDLSRPLPKLRLVPERPERIEPRAVKRRPKPYAWLNRPRVEMRKRLRQRKRRLF